MENDEAKQRMLAMMFAALLNRRFSQFTKKYGQAPVLRTWEEKIRAGGIKAFLSERELNSHTKIIDILDCLDDYCDSVEAMIQATMKSRMKTNDSALGN
jgi:hypothetical protein